MKRIADHIHKRLTEAGVKSIWTYEPRLQDLCGDLVKRTACDPPPAQMRRLAAAMSRAPDLFKVRYGRIQSLGGREARTRNFEVLERPLDA